MGEDRRVLSKSAQYRRLLKMYGGSTQEQQQQPLVADGEAREQQEQQQKEAPRAKRGAANDGCEMCQFVVQYLKIALANNETMAQASIVAAAGHRLPVCLACLAAFIRLPLLQIHVLPTNMLRPAVPAVPACRSSTTWTVPARHSPSAVAASRVSGNQMPAAQSPRFVSPALPPCRQPANTCSC